MNRLTRIVTATVIAVALGMTTLPSAAAASPAPVARRAQQAGTNLCGEIAAVRKAIEAETRRFDREYRRAQREIAYWKRAAAEAWTQSGRGEALEKQRFWLRRSLAIKAQWRAAYVLWDALIDLEEECRKLSGRAATCADLKKELDRLKARWNNLVDRVVPRLYSAARNAEAVDERNYQLAWSDLGSFGRKSRWLADRLLKAYDARRKALHDYYLKHCVLNGTLGEEPPAPTPTPTPTSTPTPSPTPTPSGTGFKVNIGGSYLHNGPGDSTVFVCSSTSPARPGAQYSMTFTRPDGSTASATGTFGPAGTTMVSAPIEQYGEYRVSIAVTSDGVTERGSATVVVGQQQGSGACR